MIWLLEQSVYRMLERAHAAGLEPTVQQCDDFLARATVEAGPGQRPRNMTVAGDVAEIRVEGVLTARPDFFAWLFGGGNTSYDHIRSALAIADSDPTIKRVIMVVDSPGGEVNGLFDTLAAIQGFAKPISVRAARATSAAYAIAAVSGKIEATNPAAEFGSIGVVASFLHLEEVVDITSTEAPKKRPDVSTEEGKAVVREHLDAIHELFVDAIATSRGLTTQAVNETFGQGAVLVAGEAKKRGMIDKLARPLLRAVRAEAEPEPAATDDNATAGTGGVQPKRKKTMTKDELKAQHPELFASVLDDGIQAGTQGERKRVLAHLKLAKTSGAEDVAQKAIESGASTMDEDVHASYLSAAMDRRDVATRQAETDGAAAIVAPAAAASEEPAADLGDKIVAVLKQQGGAVA